VLNTYSGIHDTKYVAIGCMIFVSGVNLFMNMLCCFVMLWARLKSTVLEVVSGGYDIKIYDTLCHCLYPVFIVHTQIHFRLVLNYVTATIL
jgi:hypothetical protein